MNRNDVETKYLDLCRAQIKQLDTDCMQCLFRNMRGCYPLTVQYLADQLKIRHVACSLHSVNDIWSVPLLARPFPHIVDGDWRYCTSTTASLIDFAHRNIGRSAACLHLGSPSTYKTALTAFPETGLHHLHDRNYILHGARAVEDKGNHYDVAFLDPPWYENETYMFLEIAARRLASSGLALVAQPSTLTRPGVVEERSQIIDRAKMLGFNLVQHFEDYLRYEIPHFEYVTLKQTVDYPVPADWRTGDLLVFSLDAPSASIKKNTSQVSDEYNWREVSLGPVRLKFREIGELPPFSPLESNCMMNSVSRRDVAVKKAGIWSSGNRIYSCNNSSLTLSIVSRLNCLLRRCELRESTIVEILVGTGLKPHLAFVSARAIVDDVMEHMQHAWI